MRSYLGVTLLATLLLSTAPGNTHDPRGPVKAARALEEFDVFKDGDLLLVPVTLKGKDYLFALDTGSSVSLYDTSLKHLLGEPRGAQTELTPDGGVKVTLYDPPPASLGRLALHSATPVAAADLGRLRRVSGHTIQGILGMDFLQRYTVRIDFDRGKVTFLTGVGPSPGTPVRLTYQYGCPCVAVQVPGLPAPVPFAADTGCVRYGGIQPELFRQLVERDQLTLSGVTRTETVKGVSLIKKGRLEQLSLGGFTHRHLVFGESHFNMLGLPYWSRYAITFDFPNRTVYLKKGSGFDQPARDDRSGLHLGRVSGRTLVDSVEEGCPAARAGIQPGDEIVTVAGQSVGGLRMFAIHLLLGSAGEQLEVTIRRKGEVRKATMALRPPKARAAGLLPSP
jgi:hypothetical protein